MGEETHGCPQGFGSRLPLSDPSGAAEPVVMFPDPECLLDLDMAGNCQNSLLKTGLLWKEVATTRSATHPREIAEINITIKALKDARELSLITFPTYFT